MYQKKMENDGFEVKTASDGVECLSKVAEFMPDLVLLDIMMPKMNGFEVLEKLKANASTNKIPVVILTNVGGSEQDTERGLELGAVSYIVKAGTRPRQVVAKIKEILAGYVREVPEVKA
jgi:DNA-binding response OmpR family regulator